MGREFVWARAGNLRLPPSRRSGADPFKLADQVRAFGTTVQGMPTIQVTRGARDELMINDGVTRATRIARINSDAMIEVEVIDDRPSWNLDNLPRVKERL